MSVIFLGANNPETIRMIQCVRRSNPDFNVLGFIDNDPLKKNKLFWGYTVFGGFEVLHQLTKGDVYFVNLITQNTKTRYETSQYLKKMGCQFTNFIHPSIDLTMTTLGVGNYLQEGVILQAGVTLGDNSSIHIGTVVGHETHIGSSVFIAHACSISGCVEIKDGVFIGTNATILPRLKIGRWATVGAGAVVTKDVPDGAVVVGNPAKVIRVHDVFSETGAI